MSVSKQLIHLRRVKGISQEELASMMDVTRQAVSKWETDQTLPDSEKIIRLSEIFGVSTDYLLKGTETVPMEHDSQNGSGAGSDMSAEVTEILNRVHRMSTRKRCLIGIGIIVAFLVVLLAFVFLIKL